MIRKSVTLSLIMCCIFLCLPGCSKDVEESNVNFDGLRSAVMRKVTDLTVVTEEDKNSEEIFACISDYDLKKVDRFFILHAEDEAADASKVVVIKVKEKEDAKKAEVSLRLINQERISLYQNYNSSQVPILENALIFSYENFAVLIASSEKEVIKSAFFDFVNNQ